jgi:TonB family protein
MPEGAAINLMAAMQNVAHLLPGYLMDLGNRMSEASRGGGSAGGAGAQSAEAAGGNAQGASSAVAGSHAELLAAAAGAGGAGSGDGSSASSPAAPRTQAEAASSGHLGVVVVQQSSRESALEGAEILTGQPVYTVFFDVPGSTRRWMLQYCVPGGEATASVIRPEEGRVQVMPRRAVQPPYPLDRIPVDIKGFQGDAQRLVVYAFVNEKGEAQDLRLVRGTGQEVDKAALATLRRWSFRPARRGGEAVAVEALFGIPLR